MNRAPPKGGSTNSGGDLSGGPKGGPRARRICKPPWMGNGQGRETRLAKKACETERDRTYRVGTGGINFTSKKRYDMDCVRKHLEEGTFEKEDKKCIIM